MLAFLDRLFHLQAHQSTVRKELVAGLTTFAAMAYILAVNPSILSVTGMEREGLVTVTAIAAALGCFLMAGLTNYPIALAPGMGTNAYFAFVICLGSNLPWQVALSLTFWNGIIFLLLSVTGFRRALAESLPDSVKIGVQVGIGFFIAFIGLKNVGIIVNNEATFVSIGNLTSPSSLLVIGGVILMVFLSLKKVPGAILIAILAITVVGLFIPGAGGEGHITPIPDGIVSAPHGIGETFFALNWLYPIEHFTEVWTLLLTLLILDLFDSIGTIVGVSHRAGLVDADGKLPKMGRALTADAFATIGGAMLGTSTTTSFIESAAGIESGGRTGLTSVVTGFCFLLALVFTPILTVIPAVATAPALVMVGILMAQGLDRLKFGDLAEMAPAFLTMLMIPLTFSITEGIGLGIITFVLLMALQRRFKEVPLLSWFVAALFVVYYAAH
jgi:AGZA family xanthine/uracil permease-like MFS transporter